MEAFQTEVIHHLLEAADAKSYSPLFGQTRHWQGFNGWCRESPEAFRLYTRESDEVEMVCLDAEEHVYCVRMTQETMEKIVRSLVEAYEDQALEEFFSH